MNISVLAILSSFPKLQMPVCVCNDERRCLALLRDMPMESKTRGNSVKATYVHTPGLAGVSPQTALYNNAQRVYRLPLVPDIGNKFLDKYMLKLTMDRI